MLLLLFLFSFPEGWIVPERIVSYTTIDRQTQKSAHVRTNNMYVTEWSEHQAWITTVYSHENCISPFQRLHVLFLSLKSLVVSHHLQWGTKPQQTDADRPY